MKVQLPFEGRANVFFSTLHQNPLLIVQKLPRVQSIEYIGELDYRVTLQPYRFHAGLVVQAIGHIKLEVTDNQIIWGRSDNHDESVCNGCIAGSAQPDDNGFTILAGNIEIEHHYLNMFTWGVMKPLITKIGDQFVKEFIENFYNDQFSNQVPTGA